jgi:hypothetical protein
MGISGWFSRRLLPTWFREIDLIDLENIPMDRGAVIISTHKGGLFDHMLTKGMLPGPQVAFDGFIDDEKELDLVANEVASGKNVIVFPEGDSNDESTTKTIRACAAKIAIRAKELAVENPPVIVPIGIHYSARYQFRERVALTAERPIEIIASESELVKIISGEIARASQSVESWENRKLIWQARSIIHAQRARENPDLALRTSYGEGVLGARRVRAAWEWMAIKDPKKSLRLEQRTRAHMDNLANLGLKPRNLDSKPELLTNRGFIKSIWNWLFAWSFMLGFVTWSALAGSIPPYLGVVVIDRRIGKKMKSDRRGAFKLYTAFVLYPLSWILAAAFFTWMITANSSPLAQFSQFGLILPFLFSIPSYFIFPVMLLWMPTAGKLQIKLYSKGTNAWRNMNLWRRWRMKDIDWDKICNDQKNLAKELTDIGDGLILPGDENWKNPEPGQDDFEMVSLKP